MTSEKKKEINIESKFNRVKKISSDDKIFFKPKIEAAPKMGIDNKKDILAESTLVNLSNLAAVIAIPDLLTPGISDKI